MDRLISQFEVIRAIEKYVDNIFTKNMGDLINDIKAIPSAEPCEDAISRQVVLEMAYDMSEIDGEHFTENYMVVDVADIQKLPSVKPQEPTGHWIIHEEQFNALGIAVKGGVKCSECGYTTHNKLHMDIGCPYKYCPNCGAKMEVEQ